VLVRGLGVEVTVPERLHVVVVVWGRRSLLLDDALAVCEQEAGSV
jgi:hypothetical protein